ncbi:hypothetical protein D9M71_225760 [compost metagenome]
MGVAVLEVVVVHQAHVSVEAIGVGVGHRVHRLYRVVVVAEVDQVVLVVASGGGYEIDADGGVELVAVVEADHRAEVGVADAALVVVGAVLDVQANVVERQQGVEAEVAAEHLLFGDPDETRHDGGDPQVDVGGLVAGVVTQGVSQVVADEHLTVGAGRRQDAHAVDLDAHRPGRQAAFGGLGQLGGAGEQQAGGAGNGGGAEGFLVHEMQPCCY